jgi:hypothetical protein
VAIVSRIVSHPSARALAALGLLAAAGLAACSSSSSNANGPTDSGSSADVESDSSTCAPAPDASLASFFVAPDAGDTDAGSKGPACWACIKGGCTAQLTACSQDCSCNSTVLTGAECLTGGSGDVLSCVVPLIGGSGISGFLGGGGSGINSSLMNLAACINAASCLDPCGLGGFLPPDGGTSTADGGATDSGADTGSAPGTDSGADAGVAPTSDGGTDAAADASGT